MVKFKTEIFFSLKKFNGNCKKKNIYLYIVFNRISKLNKKQKKTNKIRKLNWNVKYIFQKKTKKM